MNRLKEIAEQIGQQAQPPVHLWKPDNIGEIDIHIDSQGVWSHEGSPITREPLVRLFASILWYENGQTYLVTPVEKLRIQVDDVPFVVHQMEYVDEAWVAVINTHEQVIISSDNPVELRKFNQQWVPYLNVRYDLWARVNRSIYVQWVNEALERNSRHLREEGQAITLSSKGYEFEVAK